MTCRALSLLSLSALLVTSAGCGGAGAQALGDMEQATVESEDDATGWGMLTSAVRVYSTIRTLMDSPYDPADACPIVTEETDRVTYEGGCTDEDGTRFEGRIVVEWDENVRIGDDTVATGTVTLHEWTGISTVECGESGAFEVRATLDGRGRFLQTSDHHFEFELDYATTADDPDPETCVVESRVSAYDYRGEVVWDEAAESATFNGSGRIGFSHLGGRASVRTEDEVLDRSVCSLSAASGTTTVETGSNTVVVTYDGATDCDGSSRLSLDGVDLGEKFGLACATGARDGGGAGLLVLLALGVVVMRRRG